MEIRIIAPGTAIITPDGRVTLVGFKTDNGGIQRTRKEVVDALLGWAIKELQAAMAEGTQHEFVNCTATPAQLLP